MANIAISIAFPANIIKALQDYLIETLQEKL
jgi:hypothetical protein